MTFTTYCIWFWKITLTLFYRTILCRCCSSIQRNVLSPRNASRACTILWGGNQKSTFTRVLGKPQSQWKILEVPVYFAHFYWCRKCGIFAEGFLTCVISALQSAPSRGWSHFFGTKNPSISLWCRLDRSTFQDESFSLTSTDDCHQLRSVFDFSNRSPMTLHFS